MKQRKASRSLLGWLAAGLALLVLNCSSSDDKNYEDFFNEIGGSGGSGLGGDGSGMGGAGPCGGFGEDCCARATNGECDAPYECAAGICEPPGEWLAQQKLLAALPDGTPDGEEGDEFGWSVAIDGDTAVVGSYYSYGQSLWTGAAYVFVREGSAWSVQQKLIAELPDGTPDGGGLDYFGYSVALSGDTAVISSIQDEDQGNSSGSAYIFVRVGSTWSVQQKLTAQLPDGTPDGQADDEFGYSVSIEGDTAVIGSYFDDDQGDDSGSAYVFVRENSTWSVQQKLTAQLPGGAADGATSDIFGFSVAIDGDTAVIGSRGDDDQGDASGSAYVFVREGSTWLAQQKLLAERPDGTPDGAEFDLFGYSVAIDGETAVIGSNQSGARGAAYVFVREGSSWTAQRKLTPELPGGAADGTTADEFGWSVAISGDTAVIGSRWDDAQGDKSGAAYVFVREGSSWTAQQKLTAELPGGVADGAEGDWLGQSVALSGNTAIVGGHRDDDQGIDSGSAYVFVFE